MVLYCAMVCYAMCYAAPSPLASLSLVLILSYMSTKAGRRGIPTSDSILSYLSTEEGLLSGCGMSRLEVLSGFDMKCQGTETDFVVLSYALASYPKPATGLASSIVLRACDAMSGTELRYAPTRQRRLLHTD
eukprot:368580-Rhodomonas_salina.1